MISQLLVFGPGYSAQPVIQHVQKAGWSVFATYRSEESQQRLSEASITAVEFGAGEIQGINSDTPLHILVTIAPGEEGDPTLNIWGDWIKQAKNIETINYLSSTNVYGDHQGDWVNEETKPTPSLERGKRRLQAEADWQHTADYVGTRLFVFRLAGIYGPGRNAFSSLRKGRARCLIKENQVFSRIHVDDIRQAVWAAMNSDTASGVFNMADDEPTPPHEVIEAAAKMMGVPAPTREPWETANISEMARSFYLESKRVENSKVKEILGVKLLFPTYRTGLESLIKTDGGV